MQRFRFFFASRIAGGCLLTKQKIWAFFTQILVLVAGLEPARYLYRGILSPNTNQKAQYIVEIIETKSLYIVLF